MAVIVVVVFNKGLRGSYHSTCTPVHHLLTFFLCTNCCLYAWNTLPTFRNIWGCTPFQMTVIISWAEMNPGCCLNVSAVFATSCRNSSISCESTLNLFITTIGPASSSNYFSRVILSIYFYHFYHDIVWKTLVLAFLQVANSMLLIISWLYQGRSNNLQNKGLDRCSIIHFHHFYYESPGNRVN